MGLGTVHDLGDRGIDLGPPVAVEQFEVAPLAGLHRGDLGAQIADRARRQPHVDADDVDQVLIHLAAILILDDRDLDAFRENVGAHAAKHAADVEPVRHAAGEAGKLALVEDRQGEGEMVEMAAGDVGIVGDVDVARPDVLVAEVLDLRLHGLRHAADEHRQADTDRDGLALGREQAGGEVQRLVDDHVVGGAHEVGLHFLGHGEHAVAHDLDDHRIDLAAFRDSLLCCLGHHLAPATLITRLPYASTVMRSRGISTVVEACSSISAGPLILLPASSSARR
jgi:hypothetical protein